MDYDRSRPVIFLDIDGVLNRCGSHDGTGRYFVPECVWALDWVLDKTNAAIVLSSSWRYLTFDTDDHKAAMTLSGFEYLLRTHGLRPTAAKTVIDATASDEATESRYWQIMEWVSHHLPERYVAIDDADLSAHLHNFVKTDGRVGLTIDNAIEVVRRLGVDLESKGTGGFLPDSPNQPAPGPYQVEPYVDAIDVLDAEGVPVCHLADRKIGSTGDPPANARLLAASWSMLDTIEEILGGLTDSKYATLNEDKIARLKGVAFMARGGRPWKPQEP